MGKRQIDWARKKRLELRRLLGMKCAQCGSKYYAKLEFDVIIPVENNNHHHKKMDWSHRMSFYRRMYREGNLQLLCGGVGGCHGKKTYKETYQQDV